MAKLTKREWLLLLLRERPLDRIRLMKALFLIWHRSGRRIEDFYEFVPYMYGPCSFDLYMELDAAEHEQYVTQAPHPVMRWAPYYLTDKGSVAAKNVKRKANEATRNMIEATAKEVASENFHTLLRRVYAEAPDFASQSVVIREQSQ